MLSGLKLTYVRAVDILAGLRLTCVYGVQMCRRLAQKEGMLVGGSAGLNLHAAVELSKTAKPGSVIVAIMADNGVKYLTKIYNEDWIKAKVGLHTLTHTRIPSHLLASS